MVRALIFMVFLLATATTRSQAQLSSTYYNTKCPKALPTIRNVIRSAISAERRMAASLIRLHFHDCFVQGCDASILLDESSSIVSEKNAGPNRNSARGYEVIERAKSKVEKICPGVVSCADILAVAARDASYATGGPSWNVKLGRRDSTTANFNQANTDLPGPFSDLNTLITNFGNKGLSPRDMVALSGAHTLGQAQCFIFRDRIYSNTSDIHASFKNTRRNGCPLTSSPANDKRLAPLDLVTPNSFDNNYYKNLIQKKGLLQSDQVLFSGGSTDSIVSALNLKLEMEKGGEDILTQMRKSVEKLGSSAEMYGDPTLTRFLIARSMDADKAAKMFVQWQKWRAALVPNGFISDSEVPDELEAKKIYLQGLSNNGYPVMVVKASRHFPPKDQPQFKKFVVYTLDKIIASGFKDGEIGNEKMIAILDLQHITYKNVDARGLITGFQFLQAYYPERLAKCYILHMPRFFVSVWRMVSHFLEKATLEKIVILTNEDERREFIQDIGEETLPEEYGGRAKLVPLQDVILPSCTDGSTTG